MDDQQNQLTMPVYHGTQNDISAFNDKIPPERSSDEWENRDQNYHSMSRALGVHVAKDPVVSNSEYFTNRNLSSVGANVMPLVTHNEDKFFKIDQSRDGSGEFDPTKIDQLKHDDYAVDREILKVAYRKDPKMLAEELENQRGYSPEESKTAAGNILSGKGHIEGSGTEARPIRDLNHLITGWGMKPYNPDNRYKALKLFRDELESQGFKGVKYINTSPSEIKGASDPTCYIVFRPNELRSKFAKFDPARRHEADLTAANGGVMDDDGITAYHGSPHDFDEFDTSKIGTGESAQSYGHGLYFAQAEPTAIGYRDRLAHQGAIDLEQESHQRGIPLSREAQIELRRQAKSDADAATAAKRMQYASIEARPLPQEKLADLIDIYRKSTKGHMYEVHINAHPHHMLDWDKPLSEQSDHVQKALDSIQDHPDWTNGFKNELKRACGTNYFDGNDLYRELIKAKSAPEIAQMLHGFGIKGIKYLDAGSRGDESRQTHNYVVFDHKDVSVKRKYERGGTVNGYEDGGAVDDIPDIKNPISVFPKPQRMFPEENRPAGGQYLNAKTKEDMTGHKAAQASIGVQPGGRPFFNASAEAVEQTGSQGKGNATAKTNLFKQKAGWKWVDAPEGHEDTGTIVSVEHRGHHHYALNAHFPKGVDLARYENSTSEPRLRPTTKGNVTKGDQVGTISVRGKEHPVYNHVIVKAGGGPIVKRALELLSKDRTGR